MTDILSRIDDTGHEWISPHISRNRTLSQQQCAKCGLWRTRQSEQRSCPPGDEEPQ